MNKISDDIQKRTFNFAVDIFHLYTQIIQDHREFILSKQMLRAGTSIGANVREAQNAESKLDFIHKLSIAQKETDETIYWLELICSVMNIETQVSQKHILEAKEILKIIRSIILSTKRNLSHKDP